MQKIYVNRNIELCVCSKCIIQQGQFLMYNLLTHFVRGASRGSLPWNSIFCCCTFGRGASERIAGACCCGGSRGCTAKYIVGGGEET